MQEEKNASENNASENSVSEIKVSGIKKVKNRIMEHINQLVHYVFLRYPVTMCSILLASLSLAILIDMGSWDETVMNHINFFLWMFAAGALLAEVYIREKKLLRLVIFIPAAFLAGVFSLWMNAGPDGFVNLDPKYTDYCMMRFYGCYVGIILISCIYKMYKESGVSFEKYCLSVFASGVRSTVVYWLFAGGIAAIVTIFNILIWDTGRISALERLEIFLSGGIYVPALLLAVSRVREEVAKFARLVVEYVLLILTGVAFLIIYLYILKLIISLSLPSNEVFDILAALFIGGLPVWTMAMHFDDQLPGRIAAKMPYLFAPFIVLQIICVSIRIGEYGMTTKRYLGCVLILFEIVYIILVAIKKRKYVEMALPLLCILLLAGVMVPGINVFAMTTHWQGQRLQNELKQADMENLSQSDKEKIGNIYNSIQNEGNLEGALFLSKNYSSEEQETFEDFYYNNMGWEEDEDRVSYYSDYTLEEMDITGYDKFYRVDCNQDNTNGSSLKFIFHEGKSDEKSWTGDLTAFLNEYKEAYATGDDQDFFEKKSQEPIQIQDGVFLCVDRIMLEEKEDGTYETAALYGWVFVKGE